MSRARTRLDPRPGEVWADMREDGRQVRVLRLFLRSHSRNPWQDEVYVLAEVVADRHSAVRPQVGRTVQIASREFSSKRFALVTKEGAR